MTDLNPRCRLSSEAGFACDRHAQPMAADTAVRRFQTYLSCQLGANLRIFPVVRKNLTFSAMDAGTILLPVFGVQFSVFSAAGNPQLKTENSPQNATSPAKLHACGAVAIRITRRRLPVIHRAAILEVE